MYRRPARWPRWSPGFAPTHHIVRVDQAPEDRSPLPPWFGRLSHLDQLLATAVWEWRAKADPLAGDDLAIQL